ncbi:MAG TPA: hypothetical protein VLF21_01430 [Candidatus Saccharimonadales bacterium]|nr:hypothetical protein [Candidatus Saccharimonadales bacterium]
MSKLENNQLLARVADEGGRIISDNCLKTLRTLLDWDTTATRWRLSNLIAGGFLDRLAKPNHATKEIWLTEMGWNRLGLEPPDQFVFGPTQKLDDLRPSNVSNAHADEMERLEAENASLTQVLETLRNKITEQREEIARLKSTP